MKNKTLEELKSFLEISSKINSEITDENALLSVFLQSAMRLIHCESAFYVDFNRYGQRLKIKETSTGVLEKYKGTILEDKSVAFRCIECDHSIILSDVGGNVELSYAKKNLPDFQIDSLLAVLIKDSSRVYGIVEFFNKQKTSCFDAEDLKLVELLSVSFITAKKNFEKFKIVKNENQSYKEKLTDSVDFTFHNFVSASPVIEDLLEEVKLAAAGNSTILITGESGVGKELFAEQIYLHSSRKGFPFVRVNCASLSQTLIESELFGYVKGAFTGADTDRIGRFESADNGILFLDEIGELSLDMQVKLLRVLQEKKFEKVGSSKTISVDVRIIAATNKNLEKLVEEGKFREDLFFRLNVYNLKIPSLYERQEDIDVLSQYFLEKYSKESNKIFKGFSEDAKKVLHTYRWPGNIRELENAVARAVIIGKSDYIMASDLRLQIEQIENSLDFAEKNVSEMIDSNGQKTLKSALDNFKKVYVTKILEENNWNQTKAAKTLDIQRTYISRLMNELHIRDK